MILILTRVEKTEERMIKLTIVIFATLFSYILFIIISDQIYKLFSIDLGLLYVLATGTSSNIFHFRVIYLSNRIYIYICSSGLPVSEDIEISLNVYESSLLFPFASPFFACLRHTRETRFGF